MPFKWNDEENTSRFIFEGNADSLLFTALRRTYGKDSGGLIFVRLLVEDEELIAEYSSSPILPWSESEDPQGIEREVLARNIASISFQYAEFDEENGIVTGCEYVITGKGGYNKHTSARNGVKEFCIGKTSAQGKFRCSTPNSKL